MTLRWQSTSRFLFCLQGNPKLLCLPLGYSCSQILLGESKGLGRLLSNSPNKHTGKTSFAFSWCPLSLSPQNPLDEKATGTTSLTSSNGVRGGGERSMQLRFSHCVLQHRLIFCSHKTCCSWDCLPFRGPFKCTGTEGQKVTIITWQQLQDLNSKEHR